MTSKLVLVTALALATVVPGAVSQAQPAHAVHTAPRVTFASPGMVTHIGSARTSAPARSPNGIAGANLVRPAVRSTAGGASMRSGGIDGTAVHRPH